MKKDAPTLGNKDNDTFNIGYTTRRASYPHIGRKGEANQPNPARTAPGNHHLATPNQQGAVKIK